MASRGALICRVERSSARGKKLYLLCCHCCCTCCELGVAPASAWTAVSAGNPPESRASRSTYLQDAGPATSCLVGALTDSSASDGGGRRCSLAQGKLVLKLRRKLGQLENWITKRARVRDPETSERKMVAAWVNTRPPLSDTSTLQQLRDCDHHGRSNERERCHCRSAHPQRAAADGAAGCANRPEGWTGAAHIFWVATVHRQPSGGRRYSPPLKECACLRGVVLRPPRIEAEASCRSCFTHFCSAVMRNLCRLHRLPAGRQARPAAPRQRPAA